MPPVNSSTVIKHIRSQKRFQQIDVAKGVAIVSVILLHALPKEDLIDSYAIFHIWQAVPVFMVLMGVNLGIGFTVSKPVLFSLYTRKYFQKKMERILFPLLWVYVLSIVAGLVWQLLFDEQKLAFNSYLFIGVLPVTGRGNYFVTLVLQTIFLFPLINYLFQRQPALTLVLLVVLEVIFLVWSSQISFSEEKDYVYSAALPRYFSAIAFGLALSRCMLQPFKSSIFLLFLAIAAAGSIYLYRMVYDDLHIHYTLSEWQTQTVLTFGYAAAVVWILFKALPVSSDSKVLQLFTALGKASYHIFLIQIVYFGLVSGESALLQDIILCLLPGYLFYQADIKSGLSKRMLSWM